MKNLTYIFFILILCCIGDNVLAQNANQPYPFFRSFLDGKLDSIVISGFLPNDPGNSGTRSRSNKAKLVANSGLQLTSGTSEVGGFYLKNYEFTTTDGMHIEFEYIMKYTGTNRNELTDGICMFLVDATTGNYTGSKLKYGAEGSGFGYTHRSISDGYRPPSDYTPRQQITGMKGAYLGIALDQGPFKTLRFDGDEIRNGLYYKDNEGMPANSDPKPTKYDISSNVTVRGAAGRGQISLKMYDKTHYLNEGLWGYPVLVTRHTGITKNGASGLENEAWFELDPTTGNYTQRFASGNQRINNPFNIAGGADFTHPTQTAYRKAIIELEPNDTGDGFKITVTIQHGQEKTIVLKDYTYTLSLKYRENGLSTKGSGGGSYSNLPVVDYTIPNPDKLVIGFMASTGTKTPFTNIIKNLRITPHNAANTANDNITHHRRGPVTISPLDNDWGYKKENGETTQGPEYLDKQSFRFWSTEYHCEGDNVFEYINPDEGKWVYDPALGKVMFFPNEGFKNKTAKIRYDINGKEYPYDGPQFRSSLAEISVTIADNQPVP